MDAAGCSRVPGPEEEEATSSHGGNTSTQTSKDGIIIPNAVANQDDTTPRTQDTQEEWTFLKTESGSDMAGELFEVKTLSLIFLQSLKTTDNFSIASNMSSAGLFDDIIHVDHVNKTAHFIQLYHRASLKAFGYSMLTSSTAKFGLIKYLHTYRKIKNDYALGDTELSHCGPFENIKFVLFTNSLIDKKVYDDNNEITRVDDLFKTEGKTFSLKIDGRISEELKAMDEELSELKKLLEKLECDIKDLKDVSEIIKERVKDQMASKNQVITEKITQLMANPCKKELKILLEWKEFKYERDEDSRNEFIRKLLLCTDQPSESKLNAKIKDEIRCLWLTSASEVDGVCAGVIEGVETWWKQRGTLTVLTATSRIWTNALHRRTREYLQSCGISFVKPCTEMLWNRIQSSPSLIVGVLIKGESPTLTSIKLLEPCSCLSGNALDRSIFISLDVLSKEKVKVLTAWNSVWCNILVIECGSDLDPVAAHKLGEELVEIAELHRKKVVLITSRDHALIKYMKQQTLKYDEFEDDSRWENLQPDSQKVVRSKVVNFQDEHIHLDDVIGNQEDLRSKIDVVTLGLLLKQETLQLGKTLDKSISLYVPRRLEGIKEPVKALSDVREKVMLITGPPGMGKSTLLTELAKVTKSQDTSLWVLRLNLADCSQYLQQLESKNIIDGFEFLRAFAFDCGTPFEEALFTHCLRAGKIVILLDGADEVITYMDKVLTILEKLPKNKISALWVTSRSVVQKQIEDVLGIKATELVPFSELDQFNFLFDCWKSSHPDVNTGKLKEFVEVLLELAKTSLYEHNNPFTGVPQLIGMMAEIYEYDMEQYIQGSIKLPNTLDLARLYIGFVKKKHESYFKDKKKLDPIQAAIPANLEEKENHFRRFVINHMNAAMHLYFVERDDYEQLGISSEIDTDLEEFYEEIKNGIEKTGIIDGMDTLGQPRFVHRTFIEYLVALWLTKNYINIRDFSRNRMFDAKFKLINELFNGILTQNCPLHTSTLQRDVIQVDTLLQSQPDIVDATDGGLRTSLHLVALTYEHGDRVASVAIARSLLKHGASILLTDDVLDMRPLQLADKTQAWPIAGLLLLNNGDATDMATTKNQTGDDFNELIEFLREPRGNVTRLLEVATKHGIVSLLQYLVDEYSGDVNATGTLMHLAAQHGHEGVMTYLNEKGMSYNSTDFDGNTPLHYASRGSRRDVVKFLLDRGCDVDARNKSMETPLIIAAVCEAPALDVVMLLASKGANVNARNREGFSSLYYLVTSKKFDIVKHLLECGAKPGTFDVEELRRRIDRAERKERSARTEDEERPYPMHKSLATDIGNDKYNMEHKRRGHAVIFKHEHFKENCYPSRVGASIDATVARDTFQQLGFTVSVHNDLCLAQIKQVIKQLRQEDHHDADCIVVMVLSHGKEDGYVMAYDETYSTDYLWQSFKPDNCPSLAGKPKLFFIQGCRGDIVDHGAPTKGPPYSEKGFELVTDGRPFSDLEWTMRRRLPAAADVLIANSTVNGYVSFRNTRNGGWFIQSLCRELLEGGATIDLMKILTRTTRRVAFHYEATTSHEVYAGGKQVPSTLSMLTREVYFTPKSQYSGQICRIN